MNTIIHQRNVQLAMAIQRKEQYDDEGGLAGHLHAEFGDGPCDSSLASPYARQIAKWAFDELYGPED